MVEEASEAISDEKQEFFDWSGKNVELRFRIAIINDACYLIDVRFICFRLLLSLSLALALSLSFSFSLTCLLSDSFPLTRAHTLFSPECVWTYAIACLIVNTFAGGSETN